MFNYWYFLIPAILLALFSDIIDQQFHADKKLRKVILTFCVGVGAIVLVIFLFKQL